MKNEVADLIQILAEQFHLAARCSNSLDDFSVTKPRCSKDVLVNSFFSRAFTLWKSLLVEHFL